MKQADSLSLVNGMEALKQNLETRSYKRIWNRDKSWGVRPVGEPEIGAPGKLNAEPGVYWCWIPINFGDTFTHFGTFEDHDGNSTQLSADLVEISNNEVIKPLNNISHKVDWIKGTRWSSGAQISAQEGDKKIEINAKVCGPRFHCKGIGYQHPEWGHGFWKGEEAVGYEVWDLNEINPEDYSFFHIHQIIKATMNDSEGYGTLENLVVGRHDPSGFRIFLMLLNKKSLFIPLVLLICSCNTGYQPIQSKVSSLQMMLMFVCRISS